MGYTLEGEYRDNVRCEDAPCCGCCGPHSGGYGDPFASYDPPEPDDYDRMHDYDPGDDVEFRVILMQAGGFGDWDHDVARGQFREAWKRYLYGLGLMSRGTFRHLLLPIGAKVAPSELMGWAFETAIEAQRWIAVETDEPVEA